jgi:hypothetical protein
MSLNADMNSQLAELYTERFDTCRLIRETHEEISWPLLMEVPETYHLAPVRLKIVGQETRGWAEHIHGSTTIEELMSFYRGFNLGERYRASPFWQASNHIHKALNPEGPPRSYLWSNLLKLSQHKKRPNSEVEDMVAGLGLLQAEIEITQPQVTLFLTGPRYEERLGTTFPGILAEPVTPLFSRLKHSAFPAQSHVYRTYHPNYLRRTRKWHVIEQIAETARNELQNA